MGFGLLVGHLVGDYILQNDWMAKNKVNPHPGKEPFSLLATVPIGPDDQKNWAKAKRDYRIGHLACFSHCLWYTIAVWGFSYWWMPWWGLLACFLVHFPIDRWRLAAMWMRNVSGQAFFASKEHPMFPWSIVVVDNVFHLVTLYVIAALALGG